MTEVMKNDQRVEAEKARAEATKTTDLTTAPVEQKAEEATNNG